MKRKPSSEKISTQLYNVTCDIAIVIVRFILNVLLWVSRHILKRYFGIETPLYRLWWREHKKYMQKCIYRAYPEFIPS